MTDSEFLLGLLQVCTEMTDEMFSKHLDESKSALVLPAFREAMRTLEQQGLANVSVRDPALSGSFRVCLTELGRDFNRRTANDMMVQTLAVTLLRG